MKKINTSILAFIFTCFLWQCTSKDVGLDSSLRFPKLEKGKFWVYKITETTVLNGKSTKSDYNIKETIKDTLTVGGQLMFYVEVARKKTDEFDYKLTDSKLFFETPQGFFEKAGSITIHRLKYPVYASNEWYYNTSLGENQENKAKYLKTKQEIVLYDAKKYSNGFQIQIRNDSTGLYRKKNYEVYHPTYGLVYGELIDEDYCQENAACIGKGIVVSSKVVYKTLVGTN
jgi:hypothetical protein